MSYVYSRKISAENVEDRPRGTRRTRRTQLTDSDININNSNNVFIENDQGNKSGNNEVTSRRRTSVESKSPARNRKSKLIETMAANFERKNTENVNPTPVQRPVPNGEAKIIQPKAIPAVETAKVDATESSPPDTKKSGPSARRGKIQREKRMLRQKRRSTGVVNLKDIENNGEEKNSNEKDKELKDETEANTQSNELSPLPANDNNLVSRVTHDFSQSVISKSMITTNKPQDSSSTVSTPVTHVNLSSRYHGSRSDGTANIKMNSNQTEVDELHKKLESAEITISKLRKEIHVMDNELHVLEDENHKLKLSNKMLEDENNTMLRLIKRP